MTPPSTEFSIGTSAAAASPVRTASSAAGTDTIGTSSRVAASGKRPQGGFGEGALGTEIGVRWLT